MQSFQEARSAIRRVGAPVTLVICAALIVSFLALFFTQKLSIPASMIFSAELAGREPWRFLSYPLAAGSPIEVLFGVMAFYGFGAQIEREVSSTRFSLFLFVSVLLGSLGMLAGSLITHQTGGLAGPWPLIAAVIVAWGTRYPTAMVRVMFVIPITGKWLAWLSAPLLFFSTSPGLAPFLVLPLILAYFYAANRLSFFPWRATSKVQTKGQGMRSASEERKYLDEVMDRQRRRDEQDRLRKLFESSIKDDNNKDR